MQQVSMRVFIPVISDTQKKEKERKGLKLPKQSDESYLTWGYINSRCEKGGGQFNSKSQALKNCTTFVSV